MNGLVYKDNETCPPIVSEELWDKANEILDARSKKHNQINKNNKYSKFAIFWIDALLL